MSNLVPEGTRETAQGKYEKYVQSYNRLLVEAEMAARSTEPDSSDSTGYHVVVHVGKDVILDKVLESHGWRLASSDLGDVRWKPFDWSPTRKAVAAYVIRLQRELPEASGYRVWPMKNA